MTTQTHMRGGLVRLPSSLGYLPPAQFETTQAHRSDIGRLTTPPVRILEMVR